VRTPNLVSSDVSQQENDMTKTRLIKTAIFAALIGVAGAASIAPASAHDYDRHDGFSRDRDDHRGYDRDEHRDRHDRDGWRGHHNHRHFHRGWY
jgi:hypothetical protein